MTVARAAAWPHNTRMQSLAGKTIVITGASSGIGAEMSRHCAGLGCNVVMAARSIDKLDALAKTLGANALAVQCDVTQGGQVGALIDTTLKRFGRIDILMANAGIYIPGQVAEGDPDAWEQLMRVNVDGVLRCAHAVLPHMIARQSGDILVTSSISGHIDIHWEPVYSASKHAVQAFVHTLRRQVAKHRIRVGALAPGMVGNELWKFETPEQIEALVAKHGCLRNEDVVNAAVFMLSQPPHVTIRDLVMLPQNQDL
jgi:ribitol 2-dehydrogenase